MKLSIIIPAYNVEQYIEKCLLSCLEQDIPQSDYEIIVVNDGSPDGSLAIVERIAATATNITVVSQENGGLSAARNTGLSLAKGDYVWFVDSDDWIERNSLASLTKLMDGADFIVIGSKKIWTDRQELCYPQNADSGKELLRKGIQQPAPFYIMKREFLKTNDLKFKQGIYHEDMEFTPRMVYLADKIHTIRDCVYCYWQRENSITTTPNPKRAFDLLKVTDSLFSFKNEHVLPELQYVYDNIISLGLNNALSIVSQSNKEKQKEWINAIKKKKHLLNSLKKAQSLKYKLEGYIFSIIGNKGIITAYKLLQMFNSKQ